MGSRDITPQETQKENITKRIIINTAKTLFWEHGFDNTSPRTIQESCKVGQGSFYHHFKTKKELGKTVIEETALDMKKAAEELFNTQKTPFNRIHDYLTALREPKKGCKLGRFSYEEVIHSEDLRRPLAEYFSQIEELLEDALEQLVEEGKLDPAINREEIAQAMIAVIQGGYVLARISDDETPFHHAISGAMTMLIHLIKDK